MQVHKDRFFKLSFQIVIYHPVLSNNCNSFSVKVWYSDTPEVVLAEEQPVYTRHQQSKTDYYQNNKIKMYQCSKKLIT